MTNSTITDYYSKPGIMTSPGEYAHLFDGLPTEIGALRDVVQGLMIHVFWLDGYGLSLDEERKKEVNLRTVAKKLPRIMELDDAPLTTARPLEKRLVL